MKDTFLIGSDDVRRAGNAMQDAAADITNAANSMSDTSHKLSQTLNDFLYRFELLVQRLEKAQSTDNKSQSST